MRIAKWITQGIGVGAGILAARIFYPSAPRPKKVPRWMFTEHDKVYVAPEIDDKTLSRWVADTDKMSVAHLKELAVAILCLDQEYDDVIKRLRSMQIKPREIDGFGNGGGVGFDASRATPPAPMPSQGGRLR